MTVPGQSTCNRSFEIQEYPSRDWNGLLLAEPPKHAQPLVLLRFQTLPIQQVAQKRPVRVFSKTCAGIFEHASTYPGSSPSSLSTIVSIVGTLSVAMPVSGSTITSAPFDASSSSISSSLRPSPPDSVSRPLASAPWIYLRSNAQPNRPQHLLVQSIRKTQR